MGASAVPLWPLPSPVPPSDEGPWKLQVDRKSRRGQFNLDRAL